MAEITELKQAGFDSEQINEIMAGQDAGIDVSRYLDTAYHALQMRQIRLGLMDNLDVKKYADPMYDWLQMEELREGLILRVDISKYAYKFIPHDKMRQIKKGLKIGVDLREYMNYSAGIMRQIRKAMVSKVDLIPFVKEGYDTDQLKEIRICLEQRVDITPYLSKEYRAPAIAQIRSGILEGVDVSLYADVNYSWLQMREIKEGLISRIDARVYCNPYFDWEQMREIRKGLEEGLDVSAYATLRYPATEMKKKHNKLLENSICDAEENAILKLNAELEDSLQRLNSENPGNAAEFLLSVENGGMAAYITVKGRGEFTKADVLNFLSGRGIVFGIMEEQIDQLVESKYVGVEYLVAEGKAPVQGEDGFYEFFFRTEINKKPKLLENGAVDYKNIQWFEEVKKDQLLAVYHNAREGEPGQSVTGESIAARKGSEERILTGKGFYVDAEKKTYRAAINGMVSFSDNKLEVKNCLDVDDVNYVTGNIVFDGSLLVRGNVENGASIKTSGDIVIQGTVGSACIESGGNIILERGANAGGKGMLKAAGNINALFLETVNVECRGDVHVNSCVNCNIITGGIFESTLTVIGGRINAMSGFILKNVGSKSCVKTELKMGFRDELNRRLKLNKDRQESVFGEIKVLKNAYQDFQTKYSPEVRNSNYMYIKIENALYTKGKEIKKLQEEQKTIIAGFQKDNDVKAVVKGQIYEGAVFEASDCLFKGTDEYNVIIKKSGGQLETIPNV